jgi:hypothetical protein
MEQETLEIFAHPNFAGRAKDFYDKYELIAVIGNGEEIYSKRKLKGYSKRVCRFCGLSYPNTLFSNYSHLLPQLIGNRDLYSDFECDACNEKFSSFENDLAEYLGVSRSITGLTVDKQTKGFIAKRLRAKSRSFIGNNILILAPEDVERKDNTITIRYTKNAFVPANVYKALLKSSLSLIDAEQVKDYNHAIDYLNGESMIVGGALVAGYKLTSSLSLPLHVLVFCKKNVDDKTPTHVIVFNFQNHIIAFPMPLNNNDIPLYKMNFKIIIPPPYFTNKENMAISMPTPFKDDFSSTEKVLDQDEHLTFLLNSDELKNSYSYNPETDEYKKEEYNPAGFKYLILVKEGTLINPKELSVFIKSQENKL